MPPSLPVTRSDVDAAYGMIRSHVRRTPVLEIAPGDLGLEAHLPPIALKLEFLQHAGSFKARGAMNNLMTLDVPYAGVTAASGGNHGAALAFAAERSGVPCRIFVFDYSPQAKIDRIESYGAEVIRVEGGFEALMRATDAHAAETGALLVHAYDAPGTLAGQGTAGLEFMEQASPDTLLVATGGGGLIGGIAAWVGETAKIVSVEPAMCPTLHDALKAGAPIASPAGGIAADSLGPAKIGSLMFPIAQAHVNEAVLVSEEAIHATWRLIWDRFRIVVEPGGAVALAALLSGRYRPDSGERLGVLLCGANANVVRFPD